MENRRSFAKLIALLVVLTLALFISYMLATGQGSAPGGDPKAPPPGFTLYLPVVAKPPNTIYGNVTHGGTAAAGVELALRFYDGVAWTRIMTKTTNLNGEYSFTGMGALLPGQKYKVTYANPGNDPTRLWNWETRELTSFPNVSIANIGNFDIANLELGTPLHNALVTLPQTFTWTPRPTSLTDSYEFKLYDFNDGVPYFNTPYPYLGYANHYDLTSPQAGFLNCIPYVWGLMVHSPDGGWGWPFWLHAVTFYTAPPSGIHGCVAESGVPANGIQVELHRILKIEPFTDTKVETKTTNASGYFAFTGKPALDADHVYIVQYENQINPARLWAWYTQYLTTYTASSSVHIGDFDIADVALGLPPHNESVGLPETFSWTPRPVMQTDNYEFDLYEICDPPDPLCPLFYTDPPLGYVNHYVLNSLPPGFSYSTEYWWEIWIYHPYDEGYGLSYDSRAVTFLPPGKSAAPGKVLPLAQRQSLQFERLLRNSQAAPQAQPGLHPDDGWPHGQQIEP